MEAQNVIGTNIKTIRQMKTIYYLIIILLAPISLLAQPDTINVDIEDQVSVIVEDENAEVIIDPINGDTEYIRIYNNNRRSDTTTIEIGSYDIVIQDDAIELNRRKNKSRKSNWHQLTYWAGIDIGVNGYIMPDGDFTLPDTDEYEFMALNWGNSRTFSINPVEWKIKLYQNYIGITTGLGIEWNSYRLRNLDWKMAFNSDSTYGVYDPDIGVNKSKFRLTYINAPFLLEFNTSKYKRNNFHFAAGVVVGWRIQSMYKQRYENTSGKHKDRTVGSFNMQPFRFNAMVRVGFGGLNLFATYSLNEMFRSGTGPELYQVSAGITIVGW